MEQTYGTHPPVVTQSFASKTLRQNDTWKVYLKAHDPDGDMKYIVSVINQMGVGEYQAVRTRIGGPYRKDLDGYIYLNTSLRGNALNMNFTSLQLTLQIQDEADHYSAPVNFSLSFDARSDQEPPPPGAFQERDLGPIMIQLRSTDGIR